MKPEQFIREFGVDKAREVVAACLEYYHYYHIVEGVYYTCPKASRVAVKDLKCLVESCDMIVRFAYDIEGAKQLLELADGCGSIEFKTRTISVERFKQAIRDHESIYGGGDE